MAFMHTRYPYSLNDHDYGEFTDELEQFLSDDRSEPNRPDQWVADQQATGSTYRTKLDEMNLALAEQKTTTSAIKIIVKRMDEKLRWMRNILPTLGDESILLPFGMDKEVPKTYAEMKDYADTANSHWQTVKGDALFAPVKTLCDELDSIITDFETNRAAQETAAGEYEQRNNEKDNAREAHHIIERKIFDWYASFHPDGQDDWWTMTPWGKAPEKEEEKIPAPKGLLYDEMRNTFSWQAVPEATGYELEVKKVATGETTTYELQSNHQKAELAKGEYRAKVRAVKKSSPSQHSDWSKEIAFAIEFAAPKYLKYNAGQHEFSWDSVPGATLYQLVQDSVGNMLYMGAGTSFEYKFEGEHKFRIRALDDETKKWGEWSEWENVGAGLKPAQI